MAGAAGEGHHYLTPLLAALLSSSLFAACADATPHATGEKAQACPLSLEDERVLLVVKGEEVLAKAKAGDPKAQHEIGLFYPTGVHLGMMKENLGVCWLEQAALQEHIPAQFNLASAYRRGEGVAQNTQKAIFWYQAAAQRGERLASLHLASLYKEQGDFACAFHYLWSAADGADSLAHTARRQLNRLQEKRASEGLPRLTQSELEKQPACEAQ